VSRHRLSIKGGRTLMDLIVWILFGVIFVLLSETAYLRRQLKQKVEVEFEIYKAQQRLKQN
jgi:hypothetical protein